MTDLVRPQRIVVESEHDIVVVKLGRKDIRVGYRSAFAIAQGIRLGGNHASHAAQVNREEVVNLKRPDPSLVDPDQPTHGEFRQANVQTGVRWRIDVRGELVALVIGDVEAVFEFQDAFTLAGWIRERAIEAKKWAGDTSRTLCARGILSNASR